MSIYYSAVDIGASSGRVILSHQKNNKLVLEEIHQFKNGFSKNKRHDRWDIDQLIKEIITGLGKIKEKGITELTLGIDTWAVGYVLVDKQGNKLIDPVSYRDNRTDDAIESLSTKVSKETIYEKTGIQFQSFNMLYQLYKEDKNLIDKTDKILIIPDYIGYVLTGNAVTEITNASTTQMLNLKKGLFDDELLQHLDISSDKFAKLVDSGTVLGKIKAELKENYDLPDTKVITVATHDTASAVVGTPGDANQNWAFLSSGTWSLLGAEIKTPENGEVAYKENYTNEWGAYGTYRFLKNIIGMWMVQCIKKELKEDYYFTELAELAAEVPPFEQFIDVNDSRFTNPDNIITEIQEYCRENNQKVPESPGELVMAIYSNLALYYTNQIEKLGNILGDKIDVLNIVGGGSNITLLNQLTADLAQIDVIAGPNEATAVGNILVQMISNRELTDIAGARKLISDSFELTSYHPSKIKDLTILEEYQAFLNEGE